MTLSLDGQLWTVVEFQHVKPGKVVDKTVNAGVKVDVANVDKREMQYLYRDGSDFVFMDMETYDQLHIGETTVGSGASYLLENATATVAVHDGTPLYVEL